MKRFVWNDQKNRQLRQERKLSFEQVVSHIARGDLLDILEHHNQARYPGQRLFVVRINDYAVLVPFVENKREIFLKTIIPSRKATKLYLKGGSNE